MGVSSKNKLEIIKTIKHFCSIFYIKNTTGRSNLKNDEEEVNVQITISVPAVNLANPIKALFIDEKEAAFSLPYNLKISAQSNFIGHPSLIC